MLETDIYEVLAVALRRLVIERPVLKVPFYEVSWNRQVCCGKGPVLLRPLCAMTRKILKADQSGILAQFFLLCGKLLTGNFLECIFGTRRCGAVKCRDGNCRESGAEMQRERLSREQSSGGLNFFPA